MFRSPSNSDSKKPVENAGNARLKSNGLGNGKAGTKTDTDVAADLAGMRRLYELNRKLIGITSLETALKEILAFAIEITETDRGNIQLFKEETNSLHIVAHQGLGQPFLDHFRYNGCNTTCEAALKAQVQVVIEDTRLEQTLEGTKDLAIFEGDGIRAVQSTPLTTRHGKVIGMLSTHFSSPHRPAESQLHFLDLLASIAAEFIERTRSEEALRESEEKYRMLFETMGQGYAELEIIRGPDGHATDIRYLELNPEYERLTGIPVVKALGRTVREIIPELDDWWIQEYARIVLSGRPGQVENEVTTTGRWYEAKIYPRDGERFCVLSEEITERKRAEQRQEFLLKLSDALRSLSDPTEIMAIVSEITGRHYKVGRCGYAEVPPPYDHLVVERDWTNGSMQSLQGKIPLSVFGDEIIKQYRSGKTIVVEDTLADERNNGGEEGVKTAGGVRSGIAVQLMKESNWVASFYVQDTVVRSWTSDEVKLAEEIAERTWAAVERAKVEATLRKSEERVSKLVELMPAAVYTIDTEGRITYFNKRAAELWGREPQLKDDHEKYCGSFRMWLPDGSLLKHDECPMAPAVHQGVAARNMEVVIEQPSGHQIIVNVNIDPLYDREGKIAGAINVFTDVTERKRAEQALRDSEERIQSIANLVPDLLWGSEPDGSTNWYNRRWLEYTGQSLEQAIGWGWVDAIHPDDREGSARRYGEAVKRGQPLQQEHRIRRHDGEYRWFVVSASPFKDENGQVVKMYGAATDIHDRKQVAEALHKSELQYRARLENEVQERTNELHQNRALMQATLDSNLEMIQVFNAVRDATGKIVDFTWVLNNAASEKVYGDVIGQSLLKNNPGVVAEGIFDAFVAVTETGIPQQYEKHYVHEQFDGWFYQSVVKLNDGVATNTVDITTRKKAGQELQESRDLLQTIYNTTHVGMSVFKPVYDHQHKIKDFQVIIVNKRIEDSTNRKDLAGKLYAEEFPGIKKMGLFDLMVKAMETGEPAGLEYFYNYEGFNRWYSTMFMRNGDMLVSSNMDMTEQKQAEARNRALDERQRDLEEWQQQQIFRTILDTQEVERKRIAEALHNSLGQILYGTKLGLDQLHKAELKDGDKDSLKNVDKLLNAAITESRRLSHELMPVILEDFGLKAAVEDICRQLTGRTRFNCRFRGLTKRLDKYIEIAIYRIIQELMMNVVKHAGATEALVAVEVQKWQILILVQDNGKGFKAGAEKASGIGIKTIQNKVSLLNGNINMESEAGKGTVININIPIKSGN